MGIGDYLNKIPIIGPALAPGKTVNQPFGIQQTRPDDNGYVTNPDGTRTYASNGQTFMALNGGGFAPVTNPNVPQQVGADAFRAANFFNQVPGYDQREQGAYDRESTLADHLNSVANGIGPTVAGSQLAAGMDQAQRAQLAQASGASGGNAALSRLLAMNNTAGLMQQTNQQQALARAQEAQQAQAALANLTMNMQQQSMGMGAQKISAAQALNALAMQGQSGFEDRNLRAQLGNQQSQDSRYKDALSGIQGLGEAAMTGGAL